MKNHNAKIILISILASLSAFLFSCKATTESCIEQQETTEDKIFVYFTLLPPDATNSRMATPLVPEGINYTLTATKSGTTVEETEPFDAQNLKYRLALTSGTWTVSVIGKDENNNEVLTGSAKVIVNSDYPNGKYNPIIPVYFVNKSATYGNVQLEIDVANTPINYLKIKDLDNNNNNPLLYKDSETDKYVKETDTNKIIISKTDVNSGNWNCSLRFYDSNDNLIVTIPEIINIRSNVTTDTWVKTSDSAWLKVENGVTKFAVTKDLINSLKNYTFYVNAYGNDDNNGSSPENSFNTLQKAVNRVIALNNLDDNLQTYTIKVSGNLTSQEVNISSERILNLIIARETTNDTNSLKNTTISISNNVKVTCVNLNIGSINCSSGGISTDSQDNKYGFVLSDCELGTVNCNDGGKIKIANSNINTVTNNGIINITNAQFDALNTKNYTVQQITNTSGRITLSGGKIGTSIPNENSPAIITNSASNSTNNAEVSFTNVEILGNISGDSDSTTIFENCNISGNITVNNTDTNMILKGQSRFTDTNKYSVYLIKDAVLQIANISVFDSTTMNEQDKVLASLKTNAGSNFYTGMPVIKVSLIDPSLQLNNVINRFELHKPGHYLDFNDDNVNPQGICKQSVISISVSIPNFSGNVFSLSGVTENNDGVYVLSEDGKTNGITITKENISIEISKVKLTWGTNLIGNIEEYSESNNKIFPTSNKWYPGTYGLTVVFTYSGQEYSEQLTLKVE